MRNMVIPGGALIVIVAAWTATCDAQVQGRGSSSDRYVQGGLEYRIVQVRRHAGRFAHTFFATEAETVPFVFVGEGTHGPAEPGMFVGIAVVGGTEHFAEGHAVGPAGRRLAHVPVRAEQGESLIAEPEAQRAEEADRAGTATAQTAPTASPEFQRPPGALGPGRPVLGWSGPGLPGPGRPATRGW
jgi:hypothetical protein